MFPLFLFLLDCSAVLRLHLFATLLRLSNTSSGACCPQHAPPSNLLVTSGVAPNTLIPYAAVPSPTLPTRHPSHPPSSSLSACANKSTRNQPMPSHLPRHAPSRPTDIHALTCSHDGHSVCNHITVLCTRLHSCVSKCVHASNVHFDSTILPSGAMRPGKTPTHMPSNRRTILAHLIYCSTEGSPNRCDPL
jgi:hypothetical protein